MHGRHRAFGVRRPGLDMRRMHRGPGLRRRHLRSFVDWVRSRQLLDGLLRWGRMPVWVRQRRVWTGRRGVHSMSRGPSLRCAEPRLRAPVDWVFGDVRRVLHRKRVQPWHSHNGMRARWRGVRFMRDRPKLRQRSMRRLWLQSVEPNWSVPQRPDMPRRRVLCAGLGLRRRVLQRRGPVHRRILLPAGAGVRLDLLRDGSAVHRRRGW